MLPSRIPISAVVKNTARVSLKNKWPAASLAALSPFFAYYAVILLFGSAFYAVSGIASAILSVLCAVVLILLIPPLFLGSVRYFWRLTGGASDGPDSIFYYFSSRARYKRIFKLTVLMLMRCVSVAFVCLLPFLIVRLLSSTWLYYALDTDIPLWTASLPVVQNFLLLAGIIASFLVLLRYYLVPVTVVMDEDLLLLEAFHISVMISRQSGTAYLSLLAAFIGWFLLSLLVLPLIFTAPFFMACYVIHCRFAMVNYNLNLDFYQNNRFNNDAYRV